MKRAPDPAQSRLPTIPTDRAARLEHLQHLLGPDYNPAVEDPAFDPSAAHAHRLRGLSPEERQAAEAELAHLHAHEEPTP